MSAKPITGILSLFASFIINFTCSSQETTIAFGRISIRLKPMKCFVHLESCLTNIRFNFWFFNNFTRTVSSPILQKTWLKVDQFDNIPPIGLETKTWFVLETNLFTTSKFIVLERTNKIFSPLDTKLKTIAKTNFNEDKVLFISRALKSFERLITDGDCNGSVLIISWPYWTSSAINVSISLGANDTTELQFKIISKRL